MPGLAKFKRKQQQAQRRHERFFADKMVTMAFATNDDDDSILIFGLLASDGCTTRYLERLVGATLRVSSSDEALALDAVVDGRSIGRLATSLGGDVLPTAVAHMQAQGRDELTLGLAFFGPHGVEEVEVTLPVECARVTDDELHGDVIEVGVGPFATMTMDVHTGRIYSHRFTNRAQAEAQLERNIEQDLPFVGLKAS